jgi:hypothetical protein
MRVYDVRVVLLMLTVAVLGACSSKVGTTTTTTGTKASSGKYSEDLSGLRATVPTPVDTSKKATTVVPVDGKRNPAQYVEARHAINNSLDAVLDSISRINLSEGVIDGFTIQVYSGVKREEALNVKKQLSTALPDLDADVQFVQPNFRVRTGKYIDRLEAHKDYMAIKRYFPNAIVIPDRIRLR